MIWKAQTAKFRLFLVLALDRVLSNSTIASSANFVKIKNYYKTDININYKLFI